MNEREREGERERETERACAHESEIEQIELQAKLLNYFLGSNKSNINQSQREGAAKRQRGSPSYSLIVAFLWLRLLLIRL